MPTRRALSLVLLAALAAAAMLFSGVAPCPAAKSPFPWVKDPGKSAKQAPPAIPPHATGAQIDEILAGMDDAQVRRLLVEELKKPAAVPKEAGHETGGFARITQQVHSAMDLLGTRLAALRAGVAATPEFLPEAWAVVVPPDAPAAAPRAFAAMALLFLAGFAAEWLFRRATASSRRRIADPGSGTGFLRLRRAFARAFLDIEALGLFTLGVFFLYAVAFDKPGPRRLILLAFLAVTLSARLVLVLSRLLFAPKAPCLRILPVGDQAAAQAHIWIRRLILLFSTGLLASVILEILHAREALVILVDAATGFLVLALVFAAIARHRGVVLRLLTAGLAGGGEAPTPPQHLGALAAFLAIPWAAAVWGVWVLGLLLGREGTVAPVLAFLFALPAFAILDWGAQRLLDAALGLAHGGAAPDAAPSPAPPGGGEPQTAAPDACGYPAPVVPRLVRFVRRLLTLSVAGLVIFWVLRLWGFELALGGTVIRAALRILLAVVLTYVAWRLIEGAIARRIAKLRAERGETGDDEEGGGAGGSRAATLLRLLHKVALAVLLVMVTLIVLSAVGVDITPLLAGAGVIGLAVGFGSQALVKDIVSGLFFLIEDAFRIGDYVESGKVKGTVESISIRALRLRHPLGMISTIPFSQLGAVTNFSRDYIVSKIDFRVPFETDVKKVKRIVKKINDAVMEDPEYGPRLLAPVKTQGIRELDDSALLMRVKIRTRPGDQFVLRREVFARLQKAFKKAGIEFAHRHVVVQMPHDETALPAPGNAPEQPGTGSRAPLASAAAGAALAALLADEEKEAKALQESGE